MRKNGFTLIELLAVIVILAIIALIATPIILGIINESKKESQERSVELYASTLKNGIGAHQLRTGEKVQAGVYTTETLPFDVDYEGDVNCDTIVLYESGGLYVANCKVTDKVVDYTYGTKQQIFKPQYYYLVSDFLGNVDITLAPTDPSTESPTDMRFYLGYDIDENNKVSAAYVCFVRNDTEYCLKGGEEGETYTTNKTVLEDAFKDVENACSLDAGCHFCKADGLFARLYPIGKVSAGDGDGNCVVDGDGDFSCDVYSTGGGIIW